MTLRRPDNLNLSNWREHPQSKWSFQHVMEVLPTAAIKTKGSNRSESSTNDLGGMDDLSFSLAHLQLENAPLASLLEKSWTDAFTVTHNGKTAGFWQAPHMDVSNPHLLFSVSKSVTATVAGILEDKGLLDCTAPVSTYLDIPNESAYADCTVQHVLDMAVALAFEENYTTGADEYTQYRIASGWNPVDQTQPVQGLRDFIFPLVKNHDEHGHEFRYRSPNSDLLGMILASAGGRPFEELMSELLWTPMEAETDAYITLDYYGEARTAGGICATVSDLTRLGQLICDNGKSQSGNQVLSPRWISEILHGGNRDAWLKGDLAYVLPDGNYRNKWYQLGNQDDAICAMGIHGQYLYINPKRNVVISRVACQPLPVDDPVESALLKAMSNIAEQFG